MTPDGQTDLIAKTSGELVVFDPAATLDVDAQMTAVIDYAKRLKDWPLLEKVIAKKLEEQQEFVWWWDRTVQAPGGDRQSKHSPRSAQMEMQQAEEQTGITHQQVSRWRKRLETPERYRQQLYGAAWSAAFGTPATHVTHNSGDNEWFTPPDVIEAARMAMGGIDLDPASTEEANVVVRASSFFSAADDGLAKRWAGRVWMNPPYSGGLISPFCEKLLEHVEAGEITAACVLVNNATETAWFQSLLMACKAVCLFRTRVKFWRVGKDFHTPLQGQAVIYFGKDLKSFRNAFGGLGITLTPL